VPVRVNTLRVLQRAGYKCQAKTPQGYQCNRPAGRVHPRTGEAVCLTHATPPDVTPPASYPR
jgi:hypothetical protein